ncbi:MAG: hypothetical protein ACLP52_24720 [Streptosporangiaceae bacterium]
MTVASSKAKLAGLVAHRDPADPAITEARRDLAAANLEQHIQRIITAAPELTPEQADRLRALLPAPAAAGNGDG